MDITEKTIIYMIVHDLPMSDDTIEIYLKYLDKVTKSNTKKFDRHCSIINGLSEDEFNKYMTFLSINSKNKGV